MMYVEKIHEGHQGIVKCRGRASQTVWWPGLSSQIRELVLRCRECCKERLNAKEPLMPTRLPERPWQRVGADLFSLVDYYSHFVEVAQLSPTRSTDVIVHLKSMFARHGIPETFVSNNGPQFSGAAMKAFASDYGFDHVTSSPKFPQSNGEAERTVQPSPAAHGTSPSHPAARLSRDFTFSSPRPSSSPAQGEGAERKGG